VDHLANHLSIYLLKLPVLTVRPPDIPDSSLQVTSLPNEHSEYLLPAAVLRTCPHPEYGRKLLAALREMAPQHSKDNVFHLELDRAELLFGDLLGARADLERMAGEGEGSFELHYLLGRALYASARKDAGQKQTFMSQAASEFLAAYPLDKLNAANLYFLSRSLDDGAGAPSRDVVNAAFSAAVLAPTVGEYAFHAAFISSRAGEREKAIRALQPFASDPHNPKTVAAVATMIAQLKEGKTIRGDVGPAPVESH